MRTVLTAAGCALALSLPGPARADDEADAVKLVEKLGGEVRRDDKQPGSPVTVVILGAKATDADLKMLSAFPQLTELWLTGSQVTGTGLKDLKGLPKLAVLQLNDTKVTDNNLKDLKELKAVTTLDLRYNPGLTDACVKHLRPLKQLKTLYILNCKLTRAGVADLIKALPGCDIVG